jgi:hypothetical protein
VKIKMTASLAGPDYSLNVGDETDQFDSAEAIRFIEAGFAVPVSETEIERAIKKPAMEKRVK